MLARRFRRQSDDVVRTALDVARVDAVFLPALEALPLIGILVVLWYGSHRVLSGAITIGTDRYARLWASWQAGLVA